MTNLSEQSVIEAMVQGINEKGAKNKMMSIFGIHDKLKELGIITSKIQIDAVIDVLIQRKIVRYFKNAESGYIYYGISKQGWSAIEGANAGTNEVAATSAIGSVSDEDVPPEFNQQSNPIGFTRQPNGNGWNAVLRPTTSRENKKHLNERGEIV